MSTRQKIHILSCCVMTSFTISGLLLSGCMGVRLARVQDDKVICAGVAEVPTPKAMEGSDNLLAALSKLSAGNSAEAQNLAAKAEQSFNQAIQDSELKLKDMALIQYNIALSCFIRNDIDGGFPHIEISRAILPDESFILTLYNRMLVAKTIATSKSAQAEVARMASDMESLRKSMKETETNIINQTTAITNQNTILDRAVGKYIPIKIPDDLDKNLSLLEEQAKDVSKWPKDIAGVQQFSDALDKCIHSTPPWAEKDLLPRFNALRWEEAAFSIIVSDSKTLDQSYCEGVQLAKIDGIPQALLERVTKVKEDAETYLKTTRETAVIQAAKDSLINEKADATKALEDLGSLVEDNNPEAMALQEKLYYMLINKKAKEQIEGLKKNMETVSKIADWQLRQTGYNQIASTATQQSLAWLSENRIDKTASEELEQIRKKSQAEADNISKERAMAYQKWAFDQIKKTSQLNVLIDESCKEGNNISLNKNVKPLLKEGSSLMFKKSPGKIYGENITNIEEVRLAAIRMGMIQYLVPINPGLLDVGVSQLYQKEWEAGWKKLDGKSEQDEVAKAAGTTKKKGPADDLAN